MQWLYMRSDIYRWRYRFAIRPRRIGDKIVWLEKFAWRRLRSGEHTERAVVYGSSWIHRRYVAKGGYSADLERHLSVFCWSDEWTDAEPRPDMMT